MTKRSKVYFGFSPSPKRAGGGDSGCCDSSSSCTASRTVRSVPTVSRIAGGVRAGEMVLDPRAREVVRNGEDEMLIAELDRLRVGEPRREGGFAQCVPEAVRDL